MFETATITGIFYGTDGAAVADVCIVPKRKYLASVGDAAWVPRAVTGRTGASGQIGVFDGTTFTPGIALAIGQHDISVRKDGRSHNGVITVDADMAAARRCDKPSCGPATRPGTGTDQRRPGGPRQGA
jgi:hypothetical protein